MWTNLEGFSHLSTAELDALLIAPVRITILVGAADGELDREERRWTNRLVDARSYAKPRELNDYYRVVAAGFLEKVDAEMTHLPEDTSLRNARLNELLQGLNPVLAKLEPTIAYDLYRSFLGLAKEAAVASGGFLRIGAISPEESQWVKLPMIVPVDRPEDYVNPSEDDSWDEKGREDD
jgi:hypothetical protein